MEQQNYSCSIIADISPSEAFKSINQVKAWWAKNLDGKSENLGDVFTVHFGETWVTFKISAIIRDTKVVWEVVDCYLHWLQDKTEWNGTSIVFDIQTEVNQTKVTMTHIGLVPTVECYTQCEGGWNHFIKESLFQLLTEKVGVPA